MYKERKIIVVDCCHNCPFKGLCSPWKSLTKKNLEMLSIGNVSDKPFILKDCPLPYGEDNAAPFNGI